MPPVMFSVVTKYHKGRHSLFLYNSEIFYAFTQDILRSRLSRLLSTSGWVSKDNNYKQKKLWGNIKQRPYE
ncbi:hypothetical protein E0484_17695 (plasmid) [Lactiplantibacillus plantarum]|nr:hypothetical protein E0484_17695 [Lactiplantibacillus plantarum]